MNNSLLLKRGRKHCTELKCGKRAESGGKCYTHSGICRKWKPCQTAGCQKKAHKGGTCKRHNGGTRCRFKECNHHALQGGFCFSHGGGMCCLVPDCKKSVQGTTKYCKKHGGGMRCETPACKNSAKNGFKYCGTHGAGVTCKEDSCKTKAVVGGYCVRHGTHNLICSTTGCPHYARAGFSKCVSHGGGYRCSEVNCPNGAQGETKRCILHGGGKRCPNCIDWLDSRGGNPKYDGYCATCFKRVFPSDPRSTIIYEHSKEMKTRNAMSLHALTHPDFEGFIHDKPIYTHHCECNHRRRVDHRKLFGNTMLAVETDEHAHRNYNTYDEEIRYDDLYMMHSGKWIYIRFNPDGKSVDIEDKLITLLETMTECIERIENNENHELVEIIKLFY